MNPPVSARRPEPGPARAWLRAAAVGLLLTSLAAPSCARAAELDLQLAADGLERPVDLVTAPGDTRLYIVEQPGRIRVLENGRLRKEAFLDIRDRVSRANEQGLLSLAFHPRFARNGVLFVNYTDRDGNTNVVRYRVTPDRRMVDPSTASRILFVEQPYSNHNGGHLLFGPDSMLYIPLGDGGSAGDPHGNGQNLATLLGKLLRIDVDHGSPYAIPPDNPYARARGTRPEIWALGLRNPWRIAFDSGLLYIADVGQDQWEEIDVAPAREPGINYGWNLYEGSHVFKRIRPTPWRNPPARPALHPPAVEYSHADGCSVIGGRVYRGSIAALRGLYFYADECSGWVESFRWRNGRVEERTRWRALRGVTPTAFGADARGELYLLDLGGKVYRIAGVR